MVLPDVVKCLLLFKKIVAATILMYNHARIQAAELFSSYAHPRMFLDLDIFATGCVKAC